MPRVLVTGGAGFIGSHVVDELVVAGNEVTVLDDLSSGKRENLTIAENTGSLIFHDGSVLDSIALEVALEDVDRIIHMAVQCVRRSIGHPIQNHDVNATGTLRVLEAARKNGINRFLYCSSSEVYGNSSSEVLDEETTPCMPTTVYGAAKLAGENYTLAYFQTYGMLTTVVRPFNAYGPREHDQGDLAEVIPRFLIRVLCGQPPVIFGDGEQGRDFTYVSEVAKGIVDAAASDYLVGRVVNLARGEMITINDVASYVKAICQRNDISVNHIGERSGDVYRLHASTKLAQKLIGFSAKVDFQDGLRQYIKWFKENRPDPHLLLEQDPINWQKPK